MKWIGHNAVVGVSADYFTLIDTSRCVLPEVCGSSLLAACLVARLASVACVSWLAKLVAVVCFVLLLLLFLGGDLLRTK